MALSFTPASQRALDAAARARPTTAGSEITLDELLMGLLSEPESRGAQALAAAGVEASKVAQHWPGLRLPEATSQVDADRAASPLMSSALVHALHVVEGHCHAHPQPLVMATEHLLLALLLDPHEVGQWLAGQGLDRDKFEAEVHRRHVPPDDSDQPLSADDLPRWTATGRRAHPAAPISADVKDLHVTANAADGPPPRSIKATPTVAPALMSPPGDAASEAGEHTSAAWRMVDAAANRAAEGLRIVEDYARFGCDDGLLAGALKDLRHQLTTLCGELGYRERLASRDTPGDVGTTIGTAAEYQRGGLAEIAIANLKRAQQALRTLEEVAKLLAPQTATGFEQLRYRTYTCEKALGLGEESRERLAGARLYVLIDGCASNELLEKRVTALIHSGVDILQLRDKELSDRELLARASVLRRLTRGTRTLFVMNDRADIARLAQADGLHVGQDELSVKDARSIVGPQMLVGVSTHSIEQARQAVWDGADYIGAGPTFPSSTKQFEQLPGPQFLRQVAAEIALPAFAIGGITGANLDAVLETGMRRIAVSAAVCGATNPSAVAAELAGRLANAAGAPVKTTKASQPPS